MLKALRKSKVVLACLLLIGHVVAWGQESYKAQKGDAAVKQYFTLHAAKLGVATKDVAEMRITSDYTDSTIGIRHIYAQQQLNGLDVVNGNAALHLFINGAPAHAVYQFAKLTADKTTGAISNTVSASLSAADAIKKGMENVGISTEVNLAVKTAAVGTEQKTVFNSANTTWDIPARKAYYYDTKTKSVLLTWEVQLYRRNEQHYWIMYVDAATGAIIYKQDMVVKCDFGRPDLVTDEHLQEDKQPNQYIQPTVAENMVSVNPTFLFDGPSGAVTNAGGIVNKYRVIPLPFEAINQTGATQNLISTGGDLLASPDGWQKVTPAVSSPVAVTYPYTHGNNVWAFQDPSPTPLGGLPSVDPTRTAYNNGGFGGTFSVTEPMTFDYAIDTTKDPTTYQNAAIVNLFYINNMMHDVFYHFGFTEAAQNFEDSHSFSSVSNRGNTPLGQNDGVLAQAQDGGGTNNANFLTLLDGTPGQMQMYLWTGSVPDSLVLIDASSVHPPSNGSKFFAVQGSFGNSTVATTIPTSDIYANPVLNKPFVIVQASAAAAIGTSSEGCGTNQMSVGLPPANNVSGKIVLIDRGSCSFVEKVLGAQLGGAAGVIVINNVPGGAPIAMGGTDAPTNLITIPAVMVTYEVGKQLKEILVAGGTINGTLKKNINTPRRDGDLDNGVVSHEYGHGISTRLTAGGPNPTGHLNGGEQGGEGWSDNFALYMTTKSTDLTSATAAHPNGVLPDRGIGSYVVFQQHNGGLGIRETPYSINMAVNPSTFGYAKLSAYSEAHSIGYLWCTMLYDMQQGFIDKYGFNNDVFSAADPTASHNVPTGAGGNNVAMRLVMEALKLQPADPTFVQERDAILKADTLIYNGQHACIIWAAFAKRGLGYSAVSGTNALGDEVEQFNTAPTCNPQTILLVKKTAPSIMTNNETIDYTITATNNSPANITATNLIVTDTLPSLVTYVSSDGGTLSGNVVSWPLVSLAYQQTVTHTVKVTVSHPTPSTLLLNEDNEGATDAFTSPAGLFQQFNLITDAANAYSGSKVWYVQDYDISGSNATLVSQAPIAIPAGGGYLIFNHKYNSEPTYDGGVVEISTDNSTWTQLNTFIQNGYNSSISTTNNPFIGLATLPAFSGGSPGYVQSIANLSAYASQQIYVRFRFTSDPAGGSVTGGGWWIDDIYIASGASFVNNIAAANAANAASKVNASASTLVINSPCLSSLNLLIPTDANSYIADGNCVDNFAGWMHFYKGTNLLFSIKKTAETTGITSANVKVGIDAGTQAVLINAPYATSSFPGKNWYVMRRYWDVTSATQPTSPVSVRFYYTAAEYNELKTKATDVTTDANAKVYKINSTDNPDPAAGQSNVTAANVTFPAYTYQGVNSNYKFIQFDVTHFSGGGIGGTAPSTVLPIAGLDALKASVKNKTIVLNWRTTYETNNVGFDVLRKGPNDANFVKIGFISGAGTSTTPIDYTFTDPSAANGTVYLYELKQISTSGFVSFSNTVSARISDLLFSFSLSPNPTKDQVLLTINNDSKAVAMVYITDGLGKKVMAVNAGTDAYKQLIINISSLAKGMYLVQVNNGQTIQTEKMIVQ